MGFTFLSVALLLILGTTLGYDYESEDDCDGQVENFADLYDCRSYYECREDGEAVHSTCEDSFFDEERGICDPLLDEDDCIWRPGKGEVYFSLFFQPLSP